MEESGVLCENVRQFTSCEGVLGGEGVIFFAEEEGFLDAPCHWFVSPVAEFGKVGEALGERAVEWGAILREVVLVEDGGCFFTGEGFFRVETFGEGGREEVFFDCP